MNEQMMEKIRALLAKAESTPFGPEAEAFIGKAQELMTKYQIDEALLSSRKVVRDKPTSKAMYVVKPYAAAKVQLLMAVCKSNNCRVIQTGGVRGKPGQAVIIFGFESDLETALMLYTSLEMQAVSALNRASKPSYEHGKTFTNNFLLAFAGVIRTRLAESVRATVATHESSLLPVLRDRRAEVDQALNERFPRLYTSQAASPTYSAAGYAAGAAAGRSANIGGSAIGSSKGALGR